jgi:hypothetical protein
MKQMKQIQDKKAVKLMSETDWCIRKNDRQTWGRASKAGKRSIESASGQKKTKGGKLTK